MVVWASEVEEIVRWKRIDLSTVWFFTSLHHAPLFFLVSTHALLRFAPNTFFVKPFSSLVDHCIQCLEGNHYVSNGLRLIDVHYGKWYQFLGFIAQCLISILTANVYSFHQVNYPARL